MTTFALVHGAWHGAWCWDRLVPLLRAAGHRTVAVDLPTEDVSAGTAQYARTILDALADVDGDEPLVLVGHSAAGLTIPQVAAARPVERLVFVSALLPIPGERFVAQDERDHVLLRDYQAGVERTPDGLRRWFDPELSARYMYSNCTAQDASWAFARLRPQASTMYTEPSPLTVWPDVPMVDVRSDADLLVSPAWAAATVPDRLGVTSIVLSQAGHSSMVSHAPQLAEILLEGWAQAVSPAIPLRSSAAASSRRITAAMTRTCASSHVRASRSRRSVGARATSRSTSATASGKSATSAKKIHWAM